MAVQLGEYGAELVKGLLESLHGDGRGTVEEIPEAVLYAIGLGEADRLMLRRIGEISRGGSLMADDLEMLVDFYDSLAQNFQMVVKMKKQAE